ncbi:CPBP family intramembrane glutamic endopeptidase [Echinicola vietnamensis]|uniref:Putative metal-dependent membrane protease n=1 Tax=Echinicola vietnamensis (strain DSM 17526 / LMG 23754 / KMM 6221) TaxID=926556 RepID=L0G520_ECHVK|nr:type II CAAX endopeptidase family protein [Echinicola vietnamensis]AGA79925.1 putative metal-dependent membrane protease [Echinicola vietnamensis DSM 17526]
MNNTSTIILACLIGAIYPIYIVATHQKANNNIRQNEKYRLIDYQKTLFIFWGLTLLILFNFIAYKQPDLNFKPTLSLINLGLMILILGFAYFQYRASKITPNDTNPIIEKLKDVYHYLPKSDKELKWFMFLSISAGICEEIIFRLFLFEFLKESVNLIIAFTVTNLIFAVTHIGSGKNNLLSSFILGLLFSAIYYFTDNIWIAIILHISIDVNAGILGYRVNKLTKNKMK